MAARRWLAALGALGIGCVIAVVLVETALRVFHLAPSAGLATVTASEFARVPGLFGPRQKLVDESNRALPHLIRINGLGYRGRDFPRTRPPGELRILMLGDSFTFGDYVDDDETLPAQLEAALRQPCGPVRVINAGVGGTSIETSAEMARRALPLGIDVAVLSYSDNDISDLAVPAWDQLAENRAMKSRFPLSVAYPVLRRFALWNLLLKARGQRTTQVRGTVLGAAPPAAPTALDTSAIAAHRPASDTVVSPEAARLRAEYRSRLIALNEELARAGVPLLYAIFPGHRVFYGLIGDAQVRWVETMAREGGVRTITYADVFRADGRSMYELFLLPHDAHPSAKGYGVATRALVPALRALPVVAAHCR